MFKVNIKDTRTFTNLLFAYILLLIIHFCTYVNWCNALLRKLIFHLTFLEEEAAGRR